MTAKELLRERIETLSEHEALDVLVFLDSEDDEDAEEEFTDEDVARILEGKRAFERGDFVTGEAFEAQHGL
jgi:hypothetical protein